MNLQFLTSKTLWPMYAVVVAAFILLSMRPSLLLNSRENAAAPFCPKAWLTAIVLLVIGVAVAYFTMNNGIQNW